MFRNPLEDDFGDEAAPTSLAWKPADRNDLALISELKPPFALFGIVPGWHAFLHSGMS
jgi:hypothetical protein